jgi:chloride channel protein, CIC family
MHAVFTLREDRFFLMLAVVIGVFSGLVVVCFRLAIEWTQITLLGASLSPSFPRVVLAPTIAGIVVALLAIHVFSRVRGSGVNQVKAAMYISNGYVPFGTVIGKFFVCALAIGSGQSLGPEDPSLLMGAGIASLLGRSLPVSSVVTMRAFLGPDSLFRVPPFRLAGPGEVLAYAALGVAGGAASLLLLKWIVFARPKMQALPRWTEYFQPAAAGLLIGLIGIRFPQVMGAGYAIVDQAMHGQFVWQLLLLLAALKLLVTGFSFLSGTPGGLFAPTIFIGAMLGGAVGSIEHHFFPGLTATIGTFALVGIGTLFAGFLRTPITSVFMVIELSGNYTAILPVIISTMIAYGISRAYQKVPLFDLLARQDGLLLPSIEERREMTSFVVEDAMRTDGVLVAEPGEHIVEVARRAEANPEAALLLRMRPGEWWLLDRDDVLRLAPDAARTTTPIHAKSKGPIPYLFRDQGLAEALQVMGDWPVLPVASRADLAKLEGILTLADTLHAFRKTPKEETE